jgi:hypothetical protein
MVPLTHRDTGVDQNGFPPSKRSRTRFISSRMAEKMSFGRVAGSRFDFETSISLMAFSLQL